MSEPTTNPMEQLELVFPRQGLLYTQQDFDYILCKPKLIPLKSVTLEKLEKMQKEAEERIREAEKDTEDK